MERFTRTKWKEKQQFCEESKREGELWCEGYRNPRATCFM